MTERARRHCGDEAQGGIASSRGFQLRRCNTGSQSKRHGERVVPIFLERGADVRVFLESSERLHPLVRDHCRVVQGAEPDADAWTFLSSTDLVVVEYGHFYRLLHWLPLLVSAAARGVTPHPGPPPQGGREADNEEWSVNYADKQASAEAQRAFFDRACA